MEVEQMLNKFIVENLPIILGKYSQDEYEQILDKRDMDIFSNKWMDIYKSIHEKIEKYQVDNASSDILRKNAFKIVLANTGNSDLAAYISDDFGLFLDAVQINFNNEWLNSLWIIYKDNKIPCENIGKVNGKLEDLMCLAPT